MASQSQEMNQKSHEMSEKGQEMGQKASEATGQAQVHIYFWIDAASDVVY